jgi:hypothetical protein
MRAGGARLLAPILAIAATGAVAIWLAPTAQAAACRQTSGVTVVVDYGTAAGTSIGCATGDPTTGLDALKKSGHTYTFMPRQPGFVCTIDTLPDPCNNGPANAYWSYWHAQPDGSWSYANLGASSYSPKSGSVDGWSFGRGQPPSLRPPVAATAGTPTAGTATEGTATEGTATAAGTALGAQTPASATRDLPPDGRGGPLGLALGVSLVVLLGGIAGHLAWRRRHVSN